MSAYLGIEIGMSAARVLAIDPAGKVLAQASADYPVHHPKPLWSEQDPEDWWQAVLKAVQQVLKKAKLKGPGVKAIGLTGQMHGLVLLDERQRVVRRAVLAQDQRAAAQCVAIEQKAGGRQKLVRMVANRALQEFTAPKILWIREHEPRSFDRTAKILLPKDEIRRRLTGEIATDVTDASGTLLLDVARRRWSKALLSKLELDAALLPDCCESEDVTGQLSSEAAQKLGLSSDCLVVGGAGDSAAGAVGNGIVCHGMLATSIGTSGVVFVPSDEPRIDPLGRINTFCHAVRDKWHLLGITLTAGGALQWFRNALCKAEMASATRKAEVYNQLIKEASEAPTGAGGLLFLPYLAGERSPHADPQARGTFVGLTLKHQRGHLVRAIMEGITYSLRDSLAIIEDQAIRVKQVRATGGGAKSTLWLQLQADVLGKKVVTMTTDEGPAYGAALLAGVGAGEFKNVVEACQAAVTTTGETKPSNKSRRYYDQAFRAYQQIYSSLQESFHTLAELG